VDGTRLANAAAALDLPFRAFTTDVGVDVLSFGGTKNGLLYGEAIVALNPEAVRGLTYLRKAAMQLSSKMRFVSAQFIALLEDDLWLRNARHSNAMAGRLHEAIREIPGVSVQRLPQANAVFARIDKDVAERLGKRFRFETWDGETGEVRWVCSFDTTEADVDGFAAALAEEVRA
jgi:threonine aldolase